MTRDEVISRLKSAESDLRALGIGELYLFGSYARDEASDDSDVDLIVEFAENPGNRFRAFMGSLELLAQALARHVDFGTRSSLHPAIRDQVEREALKVFG
jgi:predicted nucleotidyltransferase